MPQETFFIPVDTAAGASPTHVRSSGRWKRKKIAKVAAFGCQIFLPDGTDFNHLIPKKATGKELLEYVFWKIDLREKEYFGLKFENKNNMKVWLDPSKRIKKQIPKRFLNTSDDSQSIPIDFHLQVKYFTPDPSSLREEFTRYLFFLHLRRDILEAKLPCSQHHAAKLFSYSIQSELGDFDATLHTPGYTGHFLFMPNQSAELERNIAEQHKERRGMSQTDAELHFLTYTVLNLEFYGLDSYPVIGIKRESLQLGLAPAGIKVYKDWKMIALFAWGRVVKVSQKKKRLSLSIKNKICSNDVEEKTVTFELDSKPLCEVLYDNLIDYLQFYRMRQSIVKETRDANQMLAKFRYSARFMKSEQEFHTRSQVLQPVSRGITPSLSYTSSSTKNPTPVDAVSALRSVRIDEGDGNFHGKFQKSQSIGGYGDRREHPDVPSLVSLSPEPPYLTFRSSQPPRIPPKMSHNKSVNSRNLAVDYGDNNSPTHSYAVIGHRDSNDFLETLKIDTSTPYRDNISHSSKQQQPQSMEINFTHHDLSTDSTESRSIATRSSSASLPSPGKSLEQIALYLAHESPIAVVRNFTLRTPEKVNESFNVSLDQIQANTNSLDQPEQRSSVMLEPPDGFSTSPQGHIFEIGTPEKQQQQQQSNRSKDDMLNQYLNSYTSPQKRTTAIGSPPTPPKRLSSFLNSCEIPMFRPCTVKDEKEVHQSLLVDEIKSKFQKEQSESVGLVRSKTPPPIKPKKRYNSTELPNDATQNEINKSLNINKTFQLPQTSYQLKIQDKSDASVQLVVVDKQKYLAEVAYENLDEKTVYQSEKMSLLQDVTQELETRHFNPKHENRPTINTTDHSKPKFNNSLSSQGINPPSPTFTSISPNHNLGKLPHPTRATHCYTHEGLVISGPHNNSITEQARSQDLDMDGTENFKITLDELYRQQSMMNILPNRFNTPPKLPSRSIETFESSLSDKGGNQNQHTDSVIGNLQKPKSVSFNNNPIVAYSTLPAKKPQSIFTSPPQQQQQPKPFGYRETSPTPIQSFSFQQQQNNIRQNPSTKPQQAPQKPQRTFPNPNPPARQVHQFVKYPNTMKQQQQQQQPAITNYPTSHWV